MMITITILDPGVLSGDAESSCQARTADHCDGQPMVSYSHGSQRIDNIFVLFFFWPDRLCSYIFIFYNESVCMSCSIKVWTAPVETSDRYGEK